MKIHITLIGREVLPTFYTIMEFQPDVTYIIGTRDSKESIKRIVRVLQQKGLKYKVRETQPVDVQATLSICEGIHAGNGESCEYIYNLTGGTKPMAFGAMMCAQRHNAKMVYTDSMDCIDITTSEHIPLSYKTDFNTLFVLQGQKLKKHEVYAPDAQRSQCARDVETFIKEERKAYDCIRRKYDSVKAEYNKNKVIPKRFGDKRCSYERNGNMAVVMYDDVEVFSSDYKDAFKMLFEGRWWETLVADAVNEWSAGRYEIWTDVEFDSKSVSNAYGRSSKSLTKNEIDVLVNLGNTLLFIECKSGKFDQNNIYKLSSVCKTYGSYKSKAVLVSFWSSPNKDRADLLEKGREENVEIIVSKNDLAQRLTEIVETLKV